VIGAAGGIPWRLSTDMRRFKRLTIGKPVIMGRATFESLGKPLVDRDNIVVTSRALDLPGITLVPTIEAAFEAARASAARLAAEEIIIAGGGQIYAATISDADRLHITHVDAEPEGDTFFPPIDPEIWLAGVTEFVPAGERDNFASSFVTYLRRAPPPSR
jgi:dihydrofolate reductase